MDKKRVIEAAMFIANRSLLFEELSEVLHIPKEEISNLCGELKREYDERGSALQIMITEKSVSMNIRPEYVRSVEAFSKEKEISKKALKILAFIAKREKVLQSELRKYFRGDIYAPVKELAEKEYISSKKKGRSRLLEITKKFKESFQISE